MRQIDKSAVTSDHTLAKHALLQIIRVRFRAFEAKFGRLPKPDEPIFFDESHHQPVKASINDALAQLGRGAKQAGVSVDPVLEFLGFSSGRVKSSERFAADARARTVPSLSYRSPRRHRSTLREANTSTGLGRFLANERLHRRHRITREELKALSSTAFLGTASTERGFLSILRVIRSSDSEGKADCPRQDA